jgi:hypothetical protein
MADAHRRKFDCVAVYKVDRWGRSLLALRRRYPRIAIAGDPLRGHLPRTDTDESNPTSDLLNGVRRPTCGASH